MATAGGIISGRILHIEPEHGACTERQKGKRKQEVQRRVYTGPALAAYELELRNHTVTMVNIETLSWTSERKLDFPCSRVWVMTIGYSEEKKTRRAASGKINFLPFC